MRPFLLLALAGATVACSDPTAPVRLVGSWTSPARDIGSGYSRAEDLDFRSDGTLRNRIRIFRNGTLESTYDATYGYSVRNDSLFTHSAADGAGMFPADYVGTRFDRARFTVTGTVLTITYPWFGPADEPITVTDVFLRQACRPVLDTCF